MTGPPYRYGTSSDLVEAGSADRIVRLEAALAAAYEALWRWGNHDTDCPYNEPSPEQIPCSCGFSAALSAPFLQRAAEELRLLREWEEAELRFDQATKAQPGQGSTERARSIARADKEASGALSALRRFREEESDAT